MLKQKIIGIIVGVIFRLINRTWRFTIVYHEGLKPLPLVAKKLDESYVVAHWHGDELALIGHAGKAPFLTITSDSKDGTIMDIALKIHGGFTTSRGSSSKGAVKALIGIMKEVEKNNYFISFATDGPRGPIHKAKPGFYSVAKKKNLPVYQMLVKCESRWNFPKSWNKTYLPKPFAKVEIHYYPMPDINSLSQEEYLDYFNQKTKPLDDEPVIRVPLKRNAHLNYMT